MAKLIQKQDIESTKGVRSIESSKFSGLLTSLVFNSFHPFDQVFSHQYELMFSADKRTVTLKLLEFRSFNRINWPERYESFRISLVIAQQADFAFMENENREYRPVVKDLETLSVATVSEWHPRSQMPEDIVLSASFDEPALQTPGTVVVVALGIEVSAYPLNATTLNTIGTGTMKIIECYVN